MNPSKHPDPHRGGGTPVPSPFLLTWGHRADSYAVVVLLPAIHGFRSKPVCYTASFRSLGRAAWERHRHRKLSRPSPYWAERGVRSTAANYPCRPQHQSPQLPVPSLQRSYRIRGAWLPSLASPIVHGWLARVSALTLPCLRPANPRAGCSDRKQ